MVPIFETDMSSALLGAVKKYPLLFIHFLTAPYAVNDIRLYEFF
jgi:hypothetical protein